MNDIMVVIGLICAIEGTLYAVFPGAMKKMCRSLLSLPESSLRVIGVTALAAGVMIIWFTK